MRPVRVRPVRARRIAQEHGTVQMLGMTLGTFSSVRQAAEVTVDLRRPGTPASTVLTCNTDHVMQQRRNAAFAACYDDATLVTVDGAPLVWLSWLIGRPVGRRVTGADLLPALGAVCADHGFRLAVVGGAPGVSDCAVAELVRQNPQLDALSVDSPLYGFEVGDEQDQEFVSQLRATKPDVVVACFGAPKQEIWMQRHRELLTGCVLVGAGAAVDFMAGTKRAPIWLQRVGSEWLFRLGSNFPRLWRRYLIYDSPFLGLALGEVWRVRVLSRFGRPLPRGQ